MKERKFVLTGTRWDRVEDFDPGPMVFRNDEALEFSRKHRKRSSWFLIALESFVIIFIGLIILFNPNSIIINTLLLLFFTAITVIITYIIMNRNQSKVNCLPKVFENSIVYSQVSYYSHDIVMMPYDQLKDIRREGDHVILQSRKKWMKWAFRFEEVGEEGFLTLRSLYEKSHAKGVPM